MSGYILNVDVEFDLDVEFDPDDTGEYIAADNIDAADRWIEKNYSTRLNPTGGLPAWDTGAKTSPHTRFCSGRWEPNLSFTALSAVPLRSWR